MGCASPYPLVAGDKLGISQKRFYRNLINRADKRFSNYLKSIVILNKNETLLSSKHQKINLASDPAEFIIRKGTRELG